MSEILVPISLGELVDKITILEIKSEKLSDPDALANVRTELELLNESLKAAGVTDSVEEGHERLRAVNLELWTIEDRIREKEADKEFDGRFIELARAVYLTNDRRARIKREINLAAGSKLIEEKSYSDYG